MPIALNPGRAVERNVLACMLADQTCMESVNLPPSAFESDALRVTYSVIQELKKLGNETITLSTLRMHFDSRPDFAEILRQHGGWAFLENLAAKPDLDNFKINLVDLKRRFDIRQAKNHAMEALELIRDSEFESSAQVYDVLDQHLINDESMDSSAIFNISELSSEWLEAQADRFEAGGFDNVGHPVQNPVLAEIFDSMFINGGMYTWAGETNVGKSNVVQMLIYYQGIEGGIPTLVIDNELSRDQFYARLLSRTSRVKFKTIISGRAYNRISKEYSDLRTGLSKIKGNHIEWRGMQDITVERIEPVVRRFLRQHQDKPHKMLIVDGIKLSSDGNSYLEVGFFAQKLKERIAKKYSTEGLIVHVTCQLNRQGNSRSIRKEGDAHADHNQIALSKLIADNSDDVIILSFHYDDSIADYDPLKRRIYVTKARDHATLQGGSYLLCDFYGAECRLEPVRIHHGGKHAEVSESEMVGSSDPELAF